MKIKNMFKKKEEIPVIAGISPNYTTYRPYQYRGLNGRIYHRIPGQGLQHYVDIADSCAGSDIERRKRSGFLKRAMSEYSRLLSCICFTDPKQRPLRRSAAVARRMVLRTSKREVHNSSHFDLTFVLL
jgi:hypothetical protein